MALADMMGELRGSMPKLPITYTRTLINRAWREIRQRGLWSFNLFNSTWTTPPPQSTGTVAVTQGSNLATLSSAANAALVTFQAANPYVLVTQMQFRVGIGNIYNIISWDGVSTLTLDQNYSDVSAAASTYTIYQVYYTPPMADFLGWISIRNPQMYLYLDITRQRDWIDQRDPQRSWYQFPTHCVPYQRDTRGQGTVNVSSTLGYPMFELWGQPLAPYTYINYGIRFGVDLINPTDTLPVPIGEDIVLAKARYYAYEWLEGNKDTQPRSSGPDFKFLMGKSQKDFMSLLSNYRREDREYVDNWFSIRERGLAAASYGFYNTLVGYAGPYTQY